MFLMGTLSALALHGEERLPQLKGQFLTGREAVLPDAAAGRVALLALGFTYESRYAVEEWIRHFRKDFGENREVTFYEIPMIGGLARMGKWFIDSGMRKGTAKADQENVITVYGGVDAWKQRVGFSDPNAAYLILIDKSGVIRWHHSGAFEESPYQALESAVKGLIGISGPR
jgi:hypothetical protein